jgi:hypothetical protein
MLRQYSEPCFKINERVAISESYSFSGDWRGEVLVVVGIETKGHKPNGEILYTLAENDNGGCYDGWKEEDLTKAWTPEGEE